MDTQTIPEVLEQLGEQASVNQIRILDLEHEVARLNRELGELRRLLAGLGATVVAALD